jgi:hypothetical protein
LLEQICPFIFLLLHPKNQKSKGAISGEYHAGPHRMTQISSNFSLVHQNCVFDSCSSGHRNFSESIFGSQQGCRLWSLPEQCFSKRKNPCSSLLAKNQGMQVFPRWKILPTLKFSNQFSEVLLLEHYLVIVLT